MLGAIVGDIIGSRFEFDNHRSKHFELFSPECFATDDSIMTLAVAKAIVETTREIPLLDEPSPAYLALLSENAVRFMREIGRRYPNCGYGGRFARWMFSDVPEPYMSYGNGAAMRVSPAGFATLDEGAAVQLAQAVTAVTHNHPEGIKGAVATTTAISMARCGASKEQIRDRIAEEFYALDFTIDAIRPTFPFNETCQQTVPQAIVCFLESDSFEDAIRTAVSLGGDSDTIAAICGAVAEAYYGVPDDIAETALAYLDRDLMAIFEDWCGFIQTV